MDDLPTTLDETYERTLLEIPEEKWKHAHHLFQCLIVSSRPLRVQELAEVLVIRLDSETAPDLISGWRPEDSEDAVLSACSSLLAIVKVYGSSVVQFSHFSVKEFLTSDRLAKAHARTVSRYHISPGPAHRLLAQACLSTLLQLDERIDKNGLKNYPLASYAARHWFDHARFGDGSLSMRDEMIELFDPDKPHFSAWIWMHDVDQGWRERSLEDLAERPSRPKGTPLYYSAACGLCRLTEQLTAIHSKDLNPLESSVRVPLRVAVNKGYFDVARLLLDHGADVNNKISNWTLLHHASYDGNSDVVQLLLEYRADVDCRADLDRTSLHLASEGGRLEAMQLLLEYRADVDSVMDHGWTPLHRASAWIKLEAVRLLLHHGANTEAVDEWGMTALHWASSLVGSFEVTRALLEGGANVHARAKSNQTPFEWASQNRYRDTAQLLLEYGTEADSE